MPTDQSDGQATRIAITLDAPEDARSDRVRQWAQEIGLPYVVNPSDRTGEFDFFLTLTKRRLELRETVASRSRPVFVDFVSGSTAWRQRSTRGRKELIARAIGIKPGEGYLVDATAGLARDTFQLAAIGYKILAIERSPILAALVDDALHRARMARNATLTKIVERITLRVGDARDILPALAQSDPPSVVYLDPMYASRDKAALASKELRICRQVVGDDPDAAGLFEVAVAKARRRVVVKRHAHAPPLRESPDISFKGRSVRYDVYLTRQ